MRPGSTLGQLLADGVKADSTTTALYGTIESIGADTIDITLDSNTSLIQKVRYTGTPRIGDRVNIQIMDGMYQAACRNRVATAFMRVDAVPRAPILASAGAATYFTDISYYSTLLDDADGILTDDADEVLGDDQT